MPRLSLRDDHIDVWLVFTNDVADDLIAEYRQCLSAHERDRENRFHFPRDRRTHVITRALVRSVLSRYAEVDPAEWRFTANEHGRPGLASSGPTQLSISFNLSHAAGLIGLAVRQRLAVGIDIENVVLRRAPLDAAERFFAKEEVSALQAVPPPARQVRFFEYWTLKESYIKARGEGLGIDLDLFSFNLDAPPGVSLSMAATLGDTPARWSFWQFRPSADHIMSLCAERAPTSESLTIRRTVPLYHEEEFRCPASRRSLAPAPGEAR